MFPIHERVTLGLCHCSHAPAMIYWLQNAGQADDSMAFVHGATRDRPPSAFVLSFQLGQPRREQKYKHIHTAK